MNFIENDLVNEKILSAMTKKFPKNLMNHFRKPWPRYKKRLTREKHLRWVTVQPSEPRPQVPEEQTREAAGQTRGATPQIQSTDSWEPASVAAEFWLKVFGNNNNNIIGIEAKLVRASLVDPCNGTFLAFKSL